MKRLLAYLTILLLLAPLLMSGWCERYERKMDRMHYRKNYLDSMRRIHQQRKDSLRALQIREIEHAKDSIRKAQDSAR